MIGLFVLVNKDGAWQAVVLDGREDDPIPEKFEDFREWVAKQVIGPAEARSKLITEHEAEATNDTPARSREMLVQQTYQVTSMELLACSSEAAAPFWQPACTQAIAAGMNVDQMLLGAEAGTEQHVINGSKLDWLLAEAHMSEQQLYNATMARLAAKLLNAAAERTLQTALMVEGAVGLWELVSISSLRDSGLTGAALRGLAEALTRPELCPDVQLPAACAVWHVSRLARPRVKLLQLGVTEGLLQILHHLFSHLNAGGTSTSSNTSPSSSSGDSDASNSCSFSLLQLQALLSAVLGALAILVVDSEARQHLISSQEGLRLLAQLATLLMPENDIEAAQQKEQPVTLVYEQPQAESTAATWEAPEVSTAEPLIQQGQLQQAQAVASNMAQEVHIPPGMPYAAVNSQAGSSTNNPGGNSSNGFVLAYALLEPVPCQMAAEVLAAVLLRDPAARDAFVQGGHLQLMLPLLHSHNQQVQLCGLAVIAHMAGLDSDGSPSLAGQDVHLLHQLHDGIAQLLQVAAEQQQQLQPPAEKQPHQQHQIKQHVSTDTNGNPELQCMLLEYGSLALWAVTAAVAPQYTEHIVLQRLVAAGELALSIMQPDKAAGTSPVVLCCLAGVLCAISTTPALQGACTAALQVSAAAWSALAQELQPVMLTLKALLESDGAELEVYHAKYMAATAVMMLASLQQEPVPLGGISHTHAGSHTQEAAELGHCTEQAAARPVHHQADQQQQQQQQGHEVSDGLLRDALHGAGLLHALLGFAKELSDEQQHNADDHSSQDQRVDAHLAADYKDAGHRLKVLCYQVVAASCQLLTAGATAMPAATCPLVLDYIWQHLGRHHHDATGTALEHRHGGTFPRVHRTPDYLPTAPYLAATLWSLLQHQQSRAQVLADNRWAAMLELLIRPAMQRVKKTATGSKGPSTVNFFSTTGSILSTVADSRDAGSPAAGVPRLHLCGLQQLQQTCGAKSSPPSSQRTALACSIIGPAVSGAAPSGSHAAEAISVLRLCVQMCWLAMQEAYNQYQAACEVPLGLDSIYARGKNSWWAMHVPQQSAAAVSASSKLALSLLVDCLGLADKMNSSLGVKALAVSSCWCLAASDKAYHSHLIELQLPQAIAAICRASKTSQQCAGVSSSGMVAAASPMSKLQQAAAGYMSTAVQCEEAVAALGGPEATSKLLADMLLTCIDCRAPAHVDLEVLKRVLSALAHLSSSSKSTLSACCSVNAVQGLLNVLRLEQQAYKELEYTAQQQYKRHNQQQQQQMVSPAIAGAAKQQSEAHSTSRNGSANAACSGSKPSTDAAGTAQDSTATSIEVDVTPLPLDVVQAPFAAVQHPHLWLDSWLQDISNISRQKPPTAVLSSASPRCRSPKPLAVKGSQSKGRKSQTPFSPASASKTSTCRTDNPPASPINCQLPACSGQHSCASGCTAHMHSEASTADCAICSSSNSSHSSPDGTEGMLALWTLLNISNNSKGRVLLCRQGLYTLIRLVHFCPDPQRVAVAAVVLDNITQAPENTDMIYKAELRLKHAAVLEQAGVKRVYRDRYQQGRESTPVPFGGSNPSSSNRGARGSSQQLVAGTAAAATGTEAAGIVAGSPNGLGAATAIGAQPCVSSSTAGAFRSPLRSSRLVLAADAAVVAANMGNLNSRGMPKHISHDVHNAGVQLAKASCTRPLSSSREIREVMQRASPSVAHLQGGSIAAAEKDGVALCHGTASGFVSVRGRESGTFGAEVQGLVAAAAGIGSKHSTPRLIGANNIGAAGRQSISGRQSVAGVGAAPPGAAMQSVRNAFMQWLQEAMPEAVGSMAGGTSRSSSAAGTVQQPVLKLEALQDLLEMADLHSTTTEDTEEAAWLTQQQQAQQLHDFYMARAAQGELLRGSLASSLRASTNTLWATTAAAGVNGSSGGGSHSAVHGQQSKIARPRSAPAGGRTARGGKAAANSNMTCSSPHGQPPAALQHSLLPPASAEQRKALSRPQTTAGRMTSPVCCTSAHAHKQDSKCSRTQQHKQQELGSRSRPGSPNPWSPTVAAYHQLSGDNIRSGQMASHLLTAAPEDYVVQELAVAATEVMEGRSPIHSPTSLHKYHTHLAATGQLAATGGGVVPATAAESYSIQLRGGATEASNHADANVQAVTDVQTTFTPAAHEHSTAWSLTSIASSGPLAVDNASDEPTVQDYSHEAVQHPDGSQELHQAVAGGPDSKFDPAGVQPGEAATEAQPDHAALLCVDSSNSVAANTQTGKPSGAVSKHTLAEHAEGSANTSKPVLMVGDYTCLGQYREGSHGTSDLDAQREQHGKPSLLLERPLTGYSQPSHGVLVGKQYIPELKGTFSAAVADSVRKNCQLMVSIRDASSPGSAVKMATTASDPAEMPSTVPRPITVLADSGGFADSPVKQVQMLIRAADDDKQPEHIVNFHNLSLLVDPRTTMHAFEHKDGARFCNDLFGHYLLPNGKQAHFYLPPAAVAQGHKVSVPGPPAVPWAVEDFLPDGLPSPPDLDSLAPSLQPEHALARLPLLQGLNWVPVPALAPSPEHACTLTGIIDAQGLHLRPGPIRLKAIVQTKEEMRQHRRPMTARQAVAAKRRMPVSTAAARPVATGQ